MVQNVNNGGIQVKGIWIFTVLSFQLFCEYKVFHVYFEKHRQKITWAVFTTILSDTIMSSKQDMKLCIHLDVQICVYPWQTAVVCNHCICTDYNMHNQQHPYFLLAPTLPLLVHGVWMWGPSTSICLQGLVGICLQLVQPEPMDIYPTALAGPVGKRWYFFSLRLSG